MGEPDSEYAKSPPFVEYAPRGDATLDAEEVSRMFKSYLDRLRKERDAISNSL